MSILGHVVRVVFVVAGLMLVSFAVLSPVFNLATAVEFLTDQRVLFVRIAALLVGFVLLLLSLRVAE